MRRVLVAGLCSILCIVVVSCGCLSGPGTAEPPVQEEDPTELLSHLTAAMTADFSAIDGVMATTAETLSDADLSGSMAQTALAGAYDLLPAAISISTIGDDGTWLLRVPENPAGAAGTGTDLSTQEWYAKASAGSVPLMTDLFPLAEGGYGVAVIHPVTGTNTTSGYLSMALDPATLVGSRAHAIENNTSYTVMVLQEDGIILYDADPAEIGSSTYDNPYYAAFPSLMATMEAVAENPAGTGSYTFYATGTTVPVTKHLVEHGRYARYGVAGCHNP
ncbi:MAG TPA: hypothetical protein ENN44_04315 [Methanoculleus sp.]|nr:hypothetical protein [Methanoculleus sp.]